MKNEARVSELNEEVEALTEKIDSLNSRIKASRKKEPERLKASLDKSTKKRTELLNIIEALTSKVQVYKRYYLDNRANELNIVELMRARKVEVPDVDYTTLDIGLDLAKDKHSEVISETIAQLTGKLEVIENFTEKLYQENFKD